VVCYHFQVPSFILLIVSLKCDLLLLLLLHLLSPLCRVFTIMYLKQTTCLGYIVLQLFFIFSLCYVLCYVMLCYVMLCYVMLCYVISPVKCVLYFHVSTFSSAQYGCFFGSSLISFFPGMLLGYCMSDFEMVPVAPVITVITHDFTFHMRRISVMRS